MNHSASLICHGGLKINGLVANPADVFVCHGNTLWRDASLAD
jgi:hypothetical protein